MEHPTELKPILNDAVDVFLGKVKNNPQRYSDNISVAFCNNLIASGGKQALGDFFAKLISAEDMYRVELSEQETAALKEAGRQKNLVQGLAHAGLGKNTKETFLSRRTFLRAAGGATVGTLIGKGISSLSPTNDEEFQELLKQIETSAERKGAIEKENERLQYLFNTPNEELSEAQKNELIIHAKAVNAFNEEIGDLNDGLKNSLQKILNSVDFVSDNPYIFTGLGIALGIYASLKGESSAQSQIKFEDSIRALDDFCNYKLNRTPHPAESVAGMGR